MQPIRVTTVVTQPCEEVFDFLDVMANHEPFTNHILRDWRYAGPDRGVGSKATVAVRAAGRTETIEIEVIAAERPTTIVEQNVGAGGRRVATGTYTLESLADGGTRITFEYAWQRAPLSDRLAAPLVRAVLARANRRAMARLAARLAALEAPRVSYAQTDHRGGGYAWEGACESGHGARGSGAGDRRVPRRRCGAR